MTACLNTDEKYKGPDILISNGNTELFTEDVLNLDRESL